MLNRRPITLDELDKLQLDDRNYLYWDGAPIQTLSRFSTPWWVNVAIIITAVGTFGPFCVNLVQLFAGSN
jgi:hypothetical protein